MRTLAAGATTALAASEVALVTLLKIEFSTGTVALNDSNFSLSYGGDTYQGAAGLGGISLVEDKPGDVTGVRFELMADGAYLAVALDDANVVQGAVVTFRTAILDPATLQIIDAPIDWIGYCDTMSISEDGNTASISVTAESKAVDLLRGTPLLYNDADQQSLVPGDRYFEYVTSQSDKPIVWPTREFFYKK